MVADSVARPIELQLPGIDNLLYFDSTSTNDGHMTIRLTFEIGTDVDIAQVQAQNRQKLAEPQLPPEVIRQGITVKKMSPDLLTVMVFQSSDPGRIAFTLANFAILRVIDNIKRLPGVGDALVFGQQNYSMRLILNPVRMAQLNLIPTDIVSVVREQNRDFPAGMVGREPMPNGTELTLPLITEGRMTEVKEFEQMIVRALPNGSIVRLKDVARIELGAQSYESRRTLQTKADHVALHVSDAGRQCARYGETDPPRNGQAGQDLPARRDLRYSLRHDAVCRSLDQRGHRTPCGMP